MIVTSRRSLILGLTSLVAAPSLVRATSLMQIKGVDMDPWVVIYQCYILSTSNRSWHWSGVNFVSESRLAGLTEFYHPPVPDMSQIPKKYQKLFFARHINHPYNNYQLVRESTAVELTGMGLKC